MTIEVRPLGVTCNIRCHYCYQNPERESGRAGRLYNLDLIKAAIEHEGGPFTLFGGEPLLVPKRDLEKLWSWGLTRFGSNGIQTNGLLVDKEHIRMFKQYRVRVGISVDGPGELNDARWAGTLDATRKATAKVEATIARLCAEGVPPSLIVTIHRGNAASDKLPALHTWLRYLDGLGIKSVRAHILEVENADVGQRYRLSTEENVRAFLSLAELEKGLTNLRFDLFSDIRALLLGRDSNVTCVWTACDPYTTRAVRGIEGGGQRSNCGRTNKEGVGFSKSEVVGFERYLALYHTPQEYEGCQGCRFFLVCKGECPGTSVNGDWRNRSEYCEVWKEVFSYFEEELRSKGMVPISLSPMRHFLEQEITRAWAKGTNLSLRTLVARQG